MAVAVAAEIVGPTESAQAGMAQRLNRFFDASGPQRGWLASFAVFAAGQYKMLTFYLRYVRPAIQAGRKAHAKTSFLICSTKNSDREILTRMPDLRRS